MWPLENLAIFEWTPCGVKLIKWLFRPSSKHRDHATIQTQHSKYKTCLGFIRPGYTCIGFIRPGYPCLGFIRPG